MTAPTPSGVVSIQEQTVFNATALSIPGADPRSRTVCILASVRGAR